MRQADKRKLVIYTDLRGTMWRKAKASEGFRGLVRITWPEIENYEKQGKWIVFKHWSKASNV